MNEAARSSNQEETTDLADDPWLMIAWEDPATDCFTDARALDRLCEEEDLYATGSRVQTEFDLDSCEAKKADVFLLDSVATLAKGQHHSAETASHLPEVRSQDTSDNNINTTCEPVAHPPQSYPSEADVSWVTKTTSAAIALATAGTLPKSSDCPPPMSGPYHPGKRRHSTATAAHGDVDPNNGEQPHDDTSCSSSGPSPAKKGSPRRLTQYAGQQALLFPSQTPTPTPPTRSGEETRLDGLEMKAERDIEDEVLLLLDALGTVVAD